MKRILFVALMLVAVLTSCQLFGGGGSGNQDIIQARTATGWRIEAKKGPGLSIGSSASITAFEGPCKKVTTSSGDDRALICTAPSVVSVTTTGEVVARIVDTVP
jgi:hypothetical protein